MAFQQFNPYIKLRERSPAFAGRGSVCLPKLNMIMFKAALASLGILTSLASAPMPAYATLTKAMSCDSVEMNGESAAINVGTIDMYLSGGSLRKPTSTEVADSVKRVNAAIAVIKLDAPGCGDPKVINLARANVSDAKLILTRFQDGE